MKHDLNSIEIVVNDKNGKRLFSYEVDLDSTAKAVANSTLPEVRIAAGVIRWAGDSVDPLEKFLLEALKKRVDQLKG